MKRPKESAAERWSILFTFIVAAPLFILYTVSHDWFQLREALMPYVLYLMMLPPLCLLAGFMCAGVFAPFIEEDDGP